MSTLLTTTSTTRPSAQAGDTYFETDTKNIIIYDGTSWRGYASDTVFGWTGSSAYSLSFDGTDDYASSPFAPSSIGTGNYSVSFWFNIDSSATDDFPYFFVMGASASLGSIYQGVGLSNRSGTTYKVRINNNFSGSYSQTVSPGLDISAGTWYHFVIVRSGNTMTLYKDGSSYLTLTNSDVGSNDLSNGSEFNLGWGAGAATTRWFYGLLDEVAVFNSALTSTQVGYIYNGQTNSGSGTATGGVPGNLNSFSPLHWWRMGDNNNNTGSTVYDQGSGAKNLSVQNGSSGSTTPTYSTNVPS